MEMSLGGGENKVLVPDWQLTAIRTLRRMVVRPEIETADWPAPSLSPNQSAGRESASGPCELFAAILFRRAPRRAGD